MENNTAQIITAIASLIGAIGVAVVAILVQLQRKTLGQVEKQGNAVSLELKRVNAVYARRVALATRDSADESVAKDAEELYVAARRSAGIQ